MAVRRQALYHAAVTLSWLIPALLSSTKHLSNQKGAWSCKAFSNTASDELQVVKWFWQVVHGLQQEQQKQLLFFVTGSDRVPIKGLASLTPEFTISRAGPHSDRLPTAHTCFNHLLLPDYQVRLHIPAFKVHIAGNC